MDKFFKVTVNGKEFDVKVEEVGGAVATANPKPTVAQQVQASVEAPKVEEPKAPVQVASSGTEIEITAPMPGGIWKILKRQGDTVKKHETILILEVMKMENEIVAPEDGTIKEILVKETDKVAAGQKLIVLA